MGGLWWFLKVCFLSILQLPSSCCHTICLNIFRNVITNSCYVISFVWQMAARNNGWGVPWIFPFFLQWGKNNKLLTGKKSHRKASFQSFCTVRGDSLVNINLNDVYPAIWRSRWSVNNNDDIVTIINELLKTSARFYIIILNSVQFLVLGKPEVIEMLFSS